MGREVQRALLWVILFGSLFMLWDNYQVWKGGESFFGSANRAKIRGVLQRWLQEDIVRWRSHKILLSRPRFAAFWNRVEPVLRTVAATEPGFPIKMPVRDLELHSEL